MIIPLVVGVLLGAFSVVFALQNTQVVSVSFFAWHLEGSLALILMAALVMGVIIALLLVLPESIGSYFKYRRLVKGHANLSEELRKQKELTVSAEKRPTPEEHSVP